MKSCRIFSADRKTRTILAVSIAVLTVLTLAALCVGAATVTPSDLWAVLQGDLTSSGARILVYARLPRVLAALAAGAGLSASGMLIQTLLANPIAGPNLIGVNAGAGVFAALACAVFPSAWAMQPVAAFLGALTAMLLVYGIARKTGASRLTLILAGVAVNSLCNALRDALQTLFPDILSASNEFRIGGLSAVSPRVLTPACILIAAGLLSAFLLRRALDVLALGDETAASLGLRVRLYKLALLTTAAVLAGAAVSFAGLMGFVGLMVPHAARFAVGGESERLLPLSAVWGAGLVLLCDTLARTLFAPHELPVGILLAFLGAPFFLWLLLRRREGQEG